MAADKGGKRKRLYELQSGLCFWCGEKMLPPEDERIMNPLYPTLDHIIPKGASSGHENNIRAACSSCNYLRGSYNTGMWKSEMRAIKDRLDKQGKTIQYLRMQIRDKEIQNKRLTEALCKFVEDHKPKESVWKTWTGKAKNFWKGTKPGS